MSSADTPSRMYAVIDDNDDNDDDDGEVLFAPSSSSDEDDNDKDGVNDDGEDNIDVYAVPSGNKPAAHGNNVADKTAATSTADDTTATATLLAPPPPSSSSYEDVLFADLFAPLPGRRVTHTPVRSEGGDKDNNDNNKADEEHAAVQTTATAATTTSSSDGSNNNTTPTEHAAAQTSTVTSASYAGGSATCMPAWRPSPQPRPLAELRAMTSMDVRLRLSRAYAAKAEHEARFRSLQATCMGNDVRGDGSSARATTPTEDKSDVADVNAPPTTRAVVAEAATMTEEQQRRRRDRCARLVNISGCGDGSEAAATDVLLPAAMTPNSLYYEQNNSNNSNSNSNTAEATAAMATQAHGRELRTLRAHQIDGIRFVWSLLVDGPVGEVPAVGAVLAHTMGLGKTAQVVVFLHLYMSAFHRSSSTAASAASARRSSSLFAAPPPATPMQQQQHASTSHALSPQRVLIVVPKSTLSSWTDEFAYWRAYFPPSHQLTLLTVDNERPAQRVALYTRWRQHGGVLLIGYESLVRLLRLVEEDALLRGVLGGSGGTRGGGDGHRKRGRHGGSGSYDADDAHARHGRRMRGGRHNDGVGTALYDDTDDNGRSVYTELMVCDEAHRLKSVRLHVVTALRSLYPLRRLLLTGTPLQNHLDEYGAMVDFALQGYFDRQRFRQFFVQPIEHAVDRHASASAVDAARKRTFTLIREVRHFVQRVDSTPLQRELPPLHEYVVVVPLSPVQRALYVRFVRAVCRHGQASFQFLAAVSMAGKIAAHPRLLYALRERQARAQRALEGGGGGGDGGGKAGTGAATAAATSASGHKNEDDTSAHAQRDNAVIDVDKDDDVGNDGNSKPRTRRKNAANNNNNGSSSSSDDEDDEDEGEDSGEDALARASHLSFSGMTRLALYEELCRPVDSNSNSSDTTTTQPLRLRDGVKLHVAMRIIAAAMRLGERTLLFSLSTALLDLFEQLLDAANAAVQQRQRRQRGSRNNNNNNDNNDNNSSNDNDDDEGVLLPRCVRYSRLDGSHTSAQRTVALRNFATTDGADVFLLSMKAGGVGVTITSATRVILVDSSFNPADDQQAIARAYRYGQTRPVFVYRLLCQHTLEYSIFQQKLAKEWLFMTVVEETTVKRDALSGMHLKEVLALLQRSATALQQQEKAEQQQQQQQPRHKLTARQAESTAEVLHEDALLRSCLDASLLVYAQRYTMFLEHDDEDVYGDAEQQYYHDFQRGMLFDVAGGGGDGSGGGGTDAAAAAAALAAQSRQAREVAAQRLQYSARTLTSIVDELIVSNLSTNPHLGKLLSAMGVQVDDATGKIRTIADVQRQQQQEQQQQQQQQQVQQQQQQQTPLANTVRDSNTTQSAAQVQPLVVVDPSRYAPYRPGSSADNAITIVDDDNDDDEDKHGKHEGESRSAV